MAFRFDAILKNRKLRDSNPPLPPFADSPRNVITNRRRSTSDTTIFNSFFAMPRLDVSRSSTSLKRNQIQRRLSIFQNSDLFDLRIEINISRGINLFSRGKKENRKKEREKEKRFTKSGPYLVIRF